VGKNEGCGRMVGDEMKDTNDTMLGFLVVIYVFYDGNMFISLPGGFRKLDYLVSIL
jgi:hypothetical protein